MKKIILKMISIAAALILCAPLLAACSGANLPGSRAERYENADRYTPVAPDGVKIGVNVKKICIYWTAGSVTFGQAFADAIELYEDSTSTLDTRTRMHYYLDGETLYVRFTASGSFTLGALSKKLTVNLPAATRYEEISQFYSGTYRFADQLTLQVNRGLNRPNNIGNLLTRPTLHSFLLIKE